MLLRTTQSFSRVFRRHAGLDHDNHLVGSFGDSPEIVPELAARVVAGIKRSTASLAHRDPDTEAQ